MGNPNPKHKFTSETAKEAAKLSRTVRKKGDTLQKKLARMQLEGITLEQLAGVLKSVSSQPVLVGLAGYAIVNQFPQLFSSIKTTSTSTSATQTPQQVQQQGLGLIFSIFPQLAQLNTSVKDAVFGASVTNAVTNGINTVVNDFEIGTLKAALILYIASGGNLAGVLSAASGPLSTIFSADTAAIAAGAAGV